MQFTIIQIYLIVLVSIYYLYSICMSNNIRMQQTSFITSGVVGYGFTIKIACIGSVIR